jgi:hypothetical protein
MLSGTRIHDLWWLSPAETNSLTSQGKYMYVETPYLGSALDSIFSRAVCSLSNFSL